MKKIYFFVFTYLVLVFGSSAQSYYQMLQQDTTTWQHWGWIISPQPQAKSQNFAPNPSNNSIAALDTISIGGILYRKLYHLNAPANLYYFNKQLIGYIREDKPNRKVYFKQTYTTTEVMLYDFGLNVNDSILLNFPAATGSLNGYYRVDSVVMKNIVAGLRRHLYLRKHLNNSNPNLKYLEFIEGIGCTFHLLYLYRNDFNPGPFNSNPCYQPWEFGLACKHDDLIQQFQSCTYTASTGWQYNSDHCTYATVITGLKTNDWDYLVKIGPNPGNDQIEVYVGENFADIKCSVTDMTGKPVLNFPKSVMNTEKNSFIFSSKDLTPGIYIVQVDLNGTVIKRPVIIQH